MSLETLLLLQRCLNAQSMTVGDPNFSDTARTVLVAMDELKAEIEKTQPATEPSS